MPAGVCKRSFDSEPRRGAGGDAAAPGTGSFRCGVARERYPETSSRAVRLQRAGVTRRARRQSCCWRAWEGGFEAREPREETEIMRDSGKEDVRAGSRAQGRQLITEEEEAWKGRARASESQEVHATARVLGGGEPTREGPGWDAQPGRGKQCDGKHRQSAWIPGLRARALKPRSGNK